MSTMTPDFQSVYATAGSEPISRPARLGARLIELLRLWRERASLRPRLGHLSDHLLKDIGLTRAEAAHEAAKPFWRG